MLFSCGCLGGVVVVVFVLFACGCYLWSCLFVACLRFVVCLFYYVCVGLLWVALVGWFLVVWVVCVVLYLVWVALLVL